MGNSSPRREINHFGRGVVVSWCRGPPPGNLVISAVVSWCRGVAVSRAPARKLVDSTVVSYCRGVARPPPGKLIDSAVLSWCCGVVWSWIRGVAGPRREINLFGRGAVVSCTMASRAPAGTREIHQFDMVSWCRGVVV